MNGVRLSQSSVALIVGNVVTFAGILFFDWNVFSVMLLYWMESIVIGYYTYKRMLKAEQSTLESALGHLAIPEPMGDGTDIKTTWKKTDRLLFGGLFLVYFVGLSIMQTPFAIIVYILVPLVTEQLTLFQLFQVCVSACFALLSHRTSYLDNYIRKKQFQVISPGKLALFTVPRLFFLQLLTISGLFLREGLSSQSFVLLCSIFLMKTLIDTISQLAEIQLMKRSLKPDSVNSPI